MSSADRELEEERLPTLHNLPSTLHHSHRHPLLTTAISSLTVFTQYSCDEDAEEQ